MSSPRTAAFILTVLLLSVAAGCDGAAQCMAAGGSCVLGGFTHCLRKGPQNCNPDRNPGGAFCCLEVVPACVDDGEKATLQASNYDRSCQVESDCIGVGVGNPCQSACNIECTNAAIHKSAEAQYRSDVAKIGPLTGAGVMSTCLCAPEPPKCCLDGTCQVGPQCLETR